MRFEFEFTEFEFVGHGRLIQIFCHVVRSRGIWEVLC